MAHDLVSKIRKDHPRVFLTRERIPNLEEEAHKSKRKIFELMKQRMRGEQAALFYTLNDTGGLGLSRPREDYGRIAAAALMDAIEKNDRRTRPDDLAILYDWAFGALTEEEKRTFVDFCKMRIGNKLNIHDGKHHGYRSPPSPQGIIAALAFFGDGIDDMYARRLLLQSIRDTLLDNLAMQHVAGTDGGFGDGTFYFLSLLEKTFKPFLALGIATDTDFFLENEVFVRMPKHLLYAMLPFPVSRTDKQDPAPYFATFHDNWTVRTREFGSAVGRVTGYIAITAAELRRRGDERKAGLYMWFLEKAFGGIPYQGEYPLSFVLMDWTIEPIAPESIGLPMAEALGWNEERGEIDRDRFGKKAGIGWVCMRSSWEDRDATFAIFKAEPFYYHGHMHRDSLAFMIAKGEELALARSGNYMCWYEGGPLGSRNPGWPQMKNFFSRTVSTNNLLVYDPEETFEGWANDGGQRLAPYWDNRWTRAYNGTENGNYRDIGGLVRFEQGRDYVYAAADATRAYNSSRMTTGGNRPKVTLVQRELVFLRSVRGTQDSFVVFDRVEATNPAFQKFWLLHLRAKPEFDGKCEVVVGGEEGGIHVSEDTSFVTVRQKRSALSVKCLLPKEGNRTVRRLGGWVTTKLEKPLGPDDDGPLDIEVDSTEGLPSHPVVILTADPPDPIREVFDRYSVWPKANHATTRAAGSRVCYFCDGKTRPGEEPARLLDCRRATKSAPAFPMPAGARVIQEFRHMGLEGADENELAERIDYPWGYGLGYNYGDGNQYGLWRVEVSPKRASRFDNFLHVLHPRLKGAATPDVELIEAAAGKVWGVKIGDRVVVFAEGPEPIRSAGYEVRGTGLHRQLLCDLIPESQYTVKKDEEQLLVGKASKQGTLPFESPVEEKALFSFETQGPGFE